MENPLCFSFRLDATDVYRYPDYQQFEHQPSRKPSSTVYTMCPVSGEGPRCVHFWGQNSAPQHGNIPKLGLSRAEKLMKMYLTFINGRPPVATEDKNDHLLPRKLVSRVGWSVPTAATMAVYATVSSRRGCRKFRMKLMEQNVRAGPVCVCAVAAAYYNFLIW